MDDTERGAGPAGTSAGHGESLADDVRPYMFAAYDRGEAFALATIAAADGGPRPVGAQMVVTADHRHGFLSDGCIDADVALHARQVLADGNPRTLVYGRGSPFIDMRLPCGGRIAVLVERIAAGDAAVAQLRRLTGQRVPAWWESDGRNRRCAALVDDAPIVPEGEVGRLYLPAPRLIVAGADAFALAIAMAGRMMRWETWLSAPRAPEALPPADVVWDRRPFAQLLDALVPDDWTAIAVATHEKGVDEAVLAPALRSGAGYVGALGSRRRRFERVAHLRAAGLDEAQIRRLRAPIGLAIGAQSPTEIAISVVGEIIALAREGSAARRQDPVAGHALAR